MYATLKEGEATEQFYLKIHYCIAALKHGHYSVDCKAEPGIVYRINSLHKNSMYLPFALQFLGKPLYILNNCSSNKTIPNDSEILSINGNPAEEITGYLKQYIFANGNNETYRYAQLGEYYQFHYLYHMLYGNPSSYKIEIFPFNQKKGKTVKVDAVLPQTIAEEYKKQNGKGINDWGKLIEYRLLDAKQNCKRLTTMLFHQFLRRSNAGV